MLHTSRIDIAALLHSMNFFSTISPIDSSRVSVYLWFHALIILGVSLCILYWQPTQKNELSQVAYVILPIFKINVNALLAVVNIHPIFTKNKILNNLLIILIEFKNQLIKFAYLSKFHSPIFIRSSQFFFWAHTVGLSFLSWKIS